MFDSGRHQTEALLHMADIIHRTLHKTLLHNLTQPLHVGLGQILALLGLLQPFVRAGTLGEARRPRLGNVAIFRHGVIYMSSVS